MIGTNRIVMRVVLVAGAVVLGVWAGRAMSPDVAMPEAGPAPAASASPREPASAPAAPSRVAKAATFPALPPADVAIAPWIDDLTARARRGDTGAAMRLATDLLRCEGWRPSETVDTLPGLAGAGPAPLFPLPGQGPWISAVDAPVRSFKDTTELHARAAKRSRQTILDRVCPGLDDTMTSQAGAWLLHAARLGDTDAMVCYAMSPDAFARPVLSDRWVQWTKRWRTEALPMMMRAYEAGDPRALEALGWAYGSARVHGLAMTPFAALVEPDPVRGTVYGELYMRLHPGQEDLPPPAWTGLDASQAREAAALFERERPRFAGRTLLPPCAALAWFR
ncbi:hypothetical protein ACQQ2N_06970 [Dokdonella sp. MW10]|uniref:hypothetical protein n=1 Tax=Dokdonella sp. MW10 TaxID=2992926 RepID=UPI003F807497